MAKKLKKKISVTTDTETMDMPIANIPLTGNCPHCGRCLHCGRGGNQGNWSSQTSPFGNGITLC